MVKAVVDIEKKVIALEADLHSDQEQALLKKGSKQKDLWGINLYPEADDDDFVEFDSMINLRPRQGNTTLSVDDEEIRKKIISLIHLCIQ